MLPVAFSVWLLPQSTFGLIWDRVRSDRKAAPFWPGRVEPCISPASASPRASPAAPRPALPTFRSVPPAAASHPAPHADSEMEGKGLCPVDKPGFSSGGRVQEGKEAENVHRIKLVPVTCEIANSDKCREGQEHRFLLSACQHQDDGCKACVLKPWSGTASVEGVLWAWAEGRVGSAAPVSALLWWHGEPGEGSPWAFALRSA